MSAPALETKGLVKRFGALAVSNDINFTLERGARHALIGPNGAGKTSFVNLVTGVLTPSSGEIRLAGETITELSRAQRVKRGLVRTFQISALFKKLTVLENVTLAIAEREGAANDLWRPAGHHRAIIETIERLPADIAVLFIEHDMELVFRVAQRITVLVQGAVLVEGAPAEIAEDPKVRQVYLGESKH